jgi:hypothetical protein
MDAILTQAATNLWQIDLQVILLSAGVFAGIAIWAARASKVSLSSTGISPYLLFAYNNFLKPHDSKAGDGQQSALESFYARQVGTGARLVRRAFSNSVFPLGWHLRHYPKAPLMWP